VSYSTEAARLIERVKVTEHFLAVEYVPVRAPDRRVSPREKVPELAA
jgi:hypothetical protein